MRARNHVEVSYALFALANQSFPSLLRSCRFSYFFEFVFSSACVLASPCSSNIRHRNPSLIHRLKLLFFGVKKPHYSIFLDYRSGLNFNFYPVSNERPSEGSLGRLDIHSFENCLVRGSQLVEITNHICRYHARDHHIL